MRLAFVALFALAFVAGGCGGGTTTVTVTTTRTVTVSAPPPSSSAASACGASQLSATFDGVPGSAGAGNIVYRLRLVNNGSSSCWVSGLPQVQLLDANGGRLPTHVRPARPGIAAAKIAIEPDGAATADARFSPDVPGVGDSQQPGQCEPTAATLRVTAPGGGSVDAPISPPTPVCERGQLSFTLYTAA